MSFSLLSAICQSMLALGLAESWFLQADRQGSAKHVICRYAHLVLAVLTLLRDLGLQGLLFATERLSHLPINTLLAFARPTAPLQLGTAVAQASADRRPQLACHLPDREPLAPLPLSGSRVSRHPSGTAFQGKKSSNPNDEAQRSAEILRREACPPVDILIACLLAPCRLLS